MSDIADFVHHNAAKVSPKILHGIHHKLPQLKLEFAEIHAPKFPHLVDQLELLADVVEDYAEGADQEIPYFVIAEACFALACLTTPGLHSSLTALWLGAGSERAMNGPTSPNWP